MHASISDRPPAARWVERLAHPGFLAMGIGCWWWMDGHELALVPALALTLLGASLLERWLPARPDWRQSGRIQGQVVQRALALALNVRSASNAHYTT